MRRRYVVEDACLQCTYGTQDCDLKPMPDRHVSAKTKGMGNMTDYDSSKNIKGFGNCINSSLSDLPNADSSGAKNHIHQVIKSGSGDPCIGLIDLLQWQNVKDDVLIGKYPALMHDSWTVCLGGLGIVTLVNSGQSEDAILTIQENLSELEAIVDAYMEENGIDPSKKGELMDSILLWNGYDDDDIRWGIKSSKEARDFCDYMQKNHKYLFGFFERRLIMDDKGNGQIDLTYLTGTAKANDGNWNKAQLASQSLAKDKAMLNGYLAAVEQDAGKSGYQTLKDFLDYYNSPNYDSSSKYNSFIPDYDLEMWEYGHDLGGMSVHDKNVHIMTYQMSSNMPNGNYAAAEEIMQQIQDGSKGGQKK